MILFLARVGMVSLFLCFSIFIGVLLILVTDVSDKEAQWCGCDGEDMAHVPGAEGFICGSEK